MDLRPLVLGSWYLANPGGPNVMANARDLGWVEASLNGIWAWFDVIRTRFEGKFSGSIELSHLES